jgi:hypothetical protein
MKKCCIYVISLPVLLLQVPENFSPGERYHHERVIILEMRQFSQCSRSIIKVFCFVLLHWPIASFNPNKVETREVFKSLVDCAKSVYKHREGIRQIVTDSIVLANFAP